MTTCSVIPQRSKGWDSTSELGAASSEGPDTWISSISSGLLLEFPLHWRVAMAVTQCLVSWGKLVVTLWSSWYIGLSKNPVVSYSCCPSAQECRQCSYQSLPLLSLLPGGRGWSIAQSDCTIGRKYSILLPIPLNRAVEFLLTWQQSNCILNKI